MGVAGAGAMFMLWDFHALFRGECSSGNTTERGFGFGLASELGLEMGLVTVRGRVRVDVGVRMTVGVGVGVGGGVGGRVGVEGKG